MLAKISKRRSQAIVGGIFAVLAVLYAVILHYTFTQDREQVRMQSGLNATVAADELQIDFARGIAVTETVEQLIIDNGGEIHDFHKVAKNLMQGFIGSIQIAPGGVVTDIYPLEGNEAGMIDLMNDPDRGPVVRYGMENDAVTMQGPFNLKQGGMGIAVRNPVFITDEKEQKTFWGFTIAIIKVPTIFWDSFEALRRLGYDYRLTSTVSPLTQEYRLVSESREGLIDPVAVTFEQGGCVWQLAVAPFDGWQTSAQQKLICLLGAVIVIFITVMTSFMLDIHAGRVRLRELVDTDTLTGLLSRSGYNHRIDQFFRRNPDGPATALFLDIDDFKMVNDLYGHDIGDEALQNLSRNLRAVFGESAFIGRTGGDEFGVFIPGRTAPEAEEMILRASQMDQTFLTSEGRQFTYTISIGYSDYPAQAATHEELTRNVDKALYNVKLNGKNGCQYYVPGMLKQSRLQFGFSQKELTMNLPGANLIREARGEGRILFANSEMIKLLDCECWDDFMAYSEGRFQNVVHREDYAELVASVKEQMIRNTEEEPLYNRYRVVTRTGRTKYVIAEARFKHHEQYGEIFFVTMLDMDA